MKTVPSYHWLYRLVEAMRAYHRGEAGGLKVNKGDPLLHTYKVEEASSWWCTGFSGNDNLFIIRPKYYKLFDEIVDKNNYMDAGGQLPTKGMCAILVGTPGVGKSSFLNYCLLRLLEDPNKVVILDIQGKKRSYRIDSEKVEEKSWVLSLFLGSTNVSPTRTYGHYI